MNPKKVLLFKIGAIGDVLLTTPLVEDLMVHDGCHLPFDTKIDYMVGEKAAAALTTIKPITFDENIFFKKDIIGMLKLIRRIRKEKYDIIFVLDKHSIFGLFAKLCGIPNRYGFDRDGDGDWLTKTVPYNNEEHEIDQYKKLIILTGKTPSNIKQIEFASKTFNHSLPKKYVCFAVGGGSNIGEDSCIRRFPIQKFNKIINMIKYPVVLVGGKEDHNLGEQIYRGHGEIHNLIGATDLQETAHIMGQAEVVVTNDSGILHLSSAVNNNIIALFGPTNPARKGPLNKGSITIWKDQDIYEPEYEFRGKLPESDKLWFTEIEPEDVVKEINKMWEKQNGQTKSK